MSLWPIYIPSRGRPNSKLIAELEGLAVVVVEPHQFASYRAAAGEKARFLQLPLDNQGITYSRNTILGLMRLSGAEWFWMLDDDISSFHLNIPGHKTAKLDAATALLRAQEIILDAPNVAQAALEYQQFAWSAKWPACFGSYCDVAVAINVPMTRLLRYQPDLKEDRDFTLQVLASGRRSMRVQEVGFRAPANGSNAGGLQDVYFSEEAWVEAMIKKWPGIITKQVKPNGRIDCKINWRFFKP